jgi:hypothetical protein
MIIKLIVIKGLHWLCLMGDRALKSSDFIVDLVDCAIVEESCPVGIQKMEERKV